MHFRHRQTDTQESRGHEALVKMTWSQMHFAVQNNIYIKQILK